MRAAGETYNQQRNEGAWKADADLAKDATSEGLRGAPGTFGTAQTSIRQ
jgi:hypothetical protein